MSVSAGVTVACATCGVPVPMAPSLANRPSRRTCPTCPKLRRVTPTVPRVTRICGQCGVTFTRRPSDIVKPGRGQFCGSVCSRAGKRKIAAEKMAKFKRTVRVAPTIAPAAWQWPVDSGSSSVVCPRCSRTRERGVRCTCEKGGVGGE